MLRTAHPLIAEGVAGERYIGSIYAGIVVGSAADQFPTQVRTWVSFNLAILRMGLVWLSGL
jgi:hypothetical protein